MAVKQICPLCERSSEQGNLWCQEPNCPAESSPHILGYGDVLGDIQVVRLLYFLRTSAIYEAQRGTERYLLKVAHPHAEEQLKREALILAQATRDPHPMLLTLLPPNQQVTLEQAPYGKMMFRGQTKYYSVFEYVEGLLLRDILLENPQPWFQNVGWLMTTLADVVAYLHIKANVLHLNLSPERILVRIDLDGIYRPMLLDLGAAVEGSAVDRAWAERHLQPAYIAPEVFKPEQPISQTADVYGLGLLMYELLAGTPAYTARLQRDNVVREAVIKNSPPALQRSDLVPEISEIVMLALDKVPGRRQADVRTFAQQIRQLFGEVPAERQPALINRQWAIIAVSLALVMTLGVLMLALVG